MAKDWGLQQAISTCQQSFRQLTVLWAGEAIESVSFEQIWNVWIAYYLGEFAEFDRKFHAYVQAGNVNYELYKPISISHHNLHRLMEVFRQELGDRMLSDTRIPERITDLQETCTRLTSLLENVSTSFSTTTRAYSDQEV